MEQARAGAHGGLEVDDWPMRPTITRPGGALPGPEESLVDLLLRNVADLHFVDYSIDEIDFRFQSSLQTRDQTIAERNRLVWFGRREIEFRDFVGHHVLNNSTADGRGQDERRECEQSDDTHVEPPKANWEKITARRGRPDEAGTSSKAKSGWQDRRCGFNAFSNFLHAAWGLPSAIEPLHGTRFARPYNWKTQHKKCDGRLSRTMIMMYRPCPQRTEPRHWRSSALAAGRTGRYNYAA